jgi:hypothetical protein
MNKLDSFASRYRVVALFLAAVFVAVGSVSVGWTAPPVTHGSTTLSHSASGKSLANLMSRSELCPAKPPSMRTCSASIGVDEMIQGHSLAQGMSWDIEPAFPCAGGNCTLNFFIQDEASSEYVTVTQEPSSDNNDLTLNATGASLGSHSFSVAYQVFDDNGEEDGSCNDISINVASGESRKAARSALSAMTQTIASTTKK